MALADAVAFKSVLADPSGFAFLAMLITKKA
jgi:hypothetical protein